MANTLVKAVIYVFSISGVIQGAAWLIMAALALSVHNEVLDLEFVPPENATHMQLLGDAFKVLYFTKNIDKVVNYNVMLVISIIYLCFSLSWMLYSALTYYLARFELLKLVKNSLAVHSLHLGAITILDVTFMVMLSLDYNDLHNEMLKNGVTQEITYLLIATGIMITIAGRGYVLLIFNIVSLFLSVVIVTCTDQCDGDDEEIFHNMIDAYSSQPRNVVEAYNEDPNTSCWEPPYQAHHFANEAYDGLEMEPPRNYRQETRAQQVEPPRLPAAKPAHYAVPTVGGVKPPPPMPPPKPQKAKPQGKKGPPIPFPDYSPPPSPKELRSVIKPHSSYY